jgi:hypothetical protein
MFIRTATGPYSEPNKSSEHSLNLSLKKYIILVKLASSKDGHLMFPGHNFIRFLTCSSYATQHAGLIVHYFIILVMFGEKYKI